MNKPNLPLTIREKQLLAELDTLARNFEIEVKTRRSRRTTYEEDDYETYEKGYLDGSVFGYSIAQVNLESILKRHRERYDSGSN